MPKKSKYDLSFGNTANLKVPVEIYNRYVAAYGVRDWAERARDVLDMATAALPMKEKEE